MVIYGRILFVRCGPIDRRALSANNQDNFQHNKALVVDAGHFGMPIAMG
jgi:hypothetical protein